jgi:hypothetical protein
VRAPTLLTQATVKRQAQEAEGPPAKKHKPAPARTTVVPSPAEDTDDDRRPVRSARQERAAVYDEILSGMERMETCQRNMVDVINKAAEVVGERLGIEIDRIVLPTMEPEALARRKRVRAFIKKIM